MKFCILLALTFMAVLGSYAEKTNGRKALVLPSNLKLSKSQIEQLFQNQNEYDDEDDEDSFDNSGNRGAVAFKPDASTGRLFFKKFFQSGKQTQSRPQIIIITRPSAQTNPTTSTSSTSDNPTVTSTGNITLIPVSRARDENDDEEEFDDEIQDQTTIAREKQPTFYKLVKGKDNRYGIVMPSKYMRDFKNQRNNFVVNPSVSSNGGNVDKGKKFRLSSQYGNFGKKKVSRNYNRPARRFASQN